MKPEEVAALRERKRMTQAEFAAWIGVNLRTVQKWEYGERGVKGAAKTLMEREKDRLDLEVTRRNPLPPKQ